MKTAKTISWLIVSGVLITGTAWYESGSFTVAAMAAFWACLLKTPVYWLHEHFWHREPRKAAKRVRVSLPVLECQLCRSEPVVCGELF